MSTQSLPSFAQAFSNHSLSSISKNNALPPIMPPSSRKRSQHDDGDDDDVRVKQEIQDTDSEGAPPPSSLMPSQKKRRVTVSGGAPQPLHIDVRPAPDHQASSTPISPVVMGFTIQRDNPNAIEQVKNMISVKQKQKALIEQRRGSAAGLMSPIGNPPRTPIDDRPQNNATPNAGATPRNRRSPNNGSGTRRLNNTSQRPPSPPLQIQQQQQQQQQPQPLQLQQQQQQPAPPPPQPQHSLPPPPISFARRRAALMGGKKKPADIVISPREAHTRDQLQPSVQSAPPIPQAGGQSQFYTSRGSFQMAIPRLPTISGSENPRRVAGNVPPTPTRLSMLHAQQAAPPVSHSNNNNNNNNVSHPLGLSLAPPSGLPTRSPPASIPIASTTRVPPTPTALHRPGYQGEKAAFLAPFEVFYDALNDSKQLKTWLSEQLREARSLAQGLAAQQDRVHELVDAQVEKKVKGLKAEVGALRGRVAELEEALAAASGSNKQGRPNGLPPPVASDAYTFPPVSSAPSNNASGSGSGSSATENAVASSSQPISSRLRAATRPEPARRRSSPGWGSEAPVAGSNSSSSAAMREAANSDAPPASLSRQSSAGSGAPMVVVSSGAERGYHERERGDSGSSLRERERERDRGREYEYEGRERERERDRDAMDGVEEDARS